MSDYPEAVANGWFPIATSAELQSKPLARVLMDQPIVLFRTQDGPAALVDRCPHRNIALSGGRMEGGEIECPYHGWRFGADGRCTLTPGVEQPAPHRATALPVVERAGVIWSTIARAPAPFPALPQPIEDDRYDRFWWPIKPSRARLLDAVENFLDPAHPHFLHGGIVRSNKHRRPVEATVRVRADYAEVIYVENARASALMPRLLEGVRTTSIGRCFAPSTGQIVFEGSSGIRLAITIFFTPVARDQVRPFAHFATPKGLAPALLKQWVLRALNAPVLIQDRKALHAQADNVDRFGGPRYAMGPLDFLLPAIRALAAGETPASLDRTVTIQL